MDGRIEADRLVSEEKTGTDQGLEVRGRKDVFFCVTRGALVIIPHRNLNLSISMETKEQSHFFAFLEARALFSLDAFCLGPILARQAVRETWLELSSASRSIALR